MALLALMRAYGGPGYGPPREFQQRHFEVLGGQRGEESEARPILPRMQELTLLLTPDLRLPAVVEEEIQQRHIQRSGDAFERLYGRHRLAVLELADEARRDPGIFGERNGREPSHLAHPSNLCAEIHRLSPQEEGRGRE